MKAEFEEKSYEAMMNFELARSNWFWAPGQVLEHSVGYDAALFVPMDHPVWGILPFEFMNGDFDRLSREVLRRRGVKVENIRCCNLFIQYKRPENLLRGSGKQMTTWKGRPFYRFDILGHQHKILLYQENRLSKAAVCYASPRFHLLKDLIDKANSNQCVNSSIFIRPNDLGAAPKVVTYSLLGNHVHFSEPKEGIPVDLKKLIFEKCAGEEEKKWSALVTDWFQLISDLSREDETVKKILESTNDHKHRDYPGAKLWRKYQVGQYVAQIFGIAWYPAFVAIDES